MDYFSVTKSGRVTGRKMMQTCLPHLPPTPPKILKTFDTPLLSIMLCSSTPPDAIWTLILVFNQFLALGGTTVTDINRTRITVLFLNLRWLLTTQCVTHPQPAITIMPDEIVRWSNLLSSTSESAMKPKNEKRKRSDELAPNLRCRRRVYATTYPAKCKCSRVTCTAA